MDICTATKRIEVALVELEYLTADALFGARGRPVHHDSQRLASFYQAACRALEISLEIIDQTNKQRFRTFAG